jgi:hypothetical protein
MPKFTGPAMEKLMLKTAAARPRPSKPNNWARGLQGRTRINREGSLECSAAIPNRELFILRAGLARAIEVYRVSPEQSARKASLKMAEFSGAD